MSLASDLAWAKRTGGRLSRTRTAAFIWNVARQQFRSRRSARRVVVSSEADTQLPDSSIVAAALAECREYCHDAIAAHCLRTFSWGCLIAVGQDLKFDRELFAVSSLLHDIEIGRTETRFATGCHCFACSGAVRAEAFAKSQGRDQVWARRVGDAISCHLDPNVPLSLGAEAHVLQAAVALDVIGVGLSRITPAARADILAKYPRNGFKAELVRTMACEAAYGEGTRAAFLMSRGFAQRVLRAPLD